MTCVHGLAERELDSWSKMADEEPWKLSEDGYLNAESESKSVICHPNLNVILLVTNSDEILVIDVNSGSVLQRSSLSANWSGNIQGTYLPGSDKLVLTDGSSIGARSDYNGVLLLDTILQPPLQKPDDVVKLELLCTEAVLLQRCLRQMELPGVYQTSEVLQELANRIKEAQSKPRKTIKSQKWNTICLELPHSILKPVCSGLVAELKRQNRNIPVLPVVSALVERLNSLMPCSSSLESGGGPVERSLMYSEAARRETFSKWPHMNYKWALPDQMAQAGFYHQPNSGGDDRAMCFTCIVCLVCWEATDEPWSEHERHSPSCPFVKGEYTQNVPISVTYATAPAICLSSSSSAELLPDSHDDVVFGTSSVSDLTVTVASNGIVNIWNVKRQLKREANFCVTGEEPLLLQKHKQQEEAQVKLKSQQTKSWKSEQNSEEFLQVDQKLERDQSDCDSYADVPKPPREAWLRAEVDGDLDDVESSLAEHLDEAFVPKSHSVELAAASIVGGPFHQRSCSNLQPVAVVGVEVMPTCVKDPPLWGGACDVVRIMNSANQASSCENGSLDIMKVREDSSLSIPPRPDEIRECSLYLVVYEFCPNVNSDDSDDDDGGNNSCGSGGDPGTGNGSDKTIDRNASATVSGSKKKYPSGTGTSASTSGSRHENNMYQDIFLPKYLYDAPVIQDGEGSIIISGGPDGIIDTLEFSPTASMLSPPEYTLNMLQMTLGSTSGGGTSIISHPILNGYLGDVKKTSSKKDVVAANTFHQEGSLKNKVFEPVAVQCVPLPVGYKIHSMHPTKDGGHLLVVLSSRRNSDGSACDGATFMDIDGDDFEQRTALVPSILLLFALDHSTDVIRINEIPVLTRELEKTDNTPVEISLLPLQEREDTSDIDDCETDTLSSSQPAGLALVICADGKLKVLDVATFRFVAEAFPSGDARFVSATYCSNLERICACTEKGSLHFFPLRWNEMGMLPFLPASTQPQPSTSSGRGVPIYSSELLINSPLRLSVLHQLLDLTRCENLTPCYAATFPPCWSEMMQAQKQRRHPQHLQQGDDAQHTRTWRLQRDATTWDEHVFEITLPKSCTVGHVCLKFSFHSACSPPPNIQVTLLKQNVSGIGHKQPAGMPVDSKVDFGLGIDQSNCKDFIENPVTSEEYLQAHNAEILCGPVNLAQCLDLSDQGGSLILTSPKLLRTRSRTLLLHLKAVSVDPSAVPRIAEEKPSSKKSKIDNSTGGTSSNSSGNSTVPNPNAKCVIVFKGKAHISQMQLKKAEIFLGCDWLQEVSVAIRRTKQTSINNERNQRCAMLESNPFVEKLLEVVCLEGPDKTAPAQKLALDILSWVLSIRLSPHTSGGSESCGKLPLPQSDVGRIIKGHLSELIQHCFISGCRSIAHKCLKLILVCVDGLKAVKESEGRDLEISVLEAMLEWLPAVGSVKSAGALHWFLMLLKRVGPFDSADIAANECVSLLTHVAQELSTRRNPYHLLLRARFGLYGMPFEPELFDVDPPVAGKSTSVPITYASVVQGEAGINSTTSGTIFGLSSGQAYEPLDLRELLAMHASLSSDKLLAAINNTGNNPLSSESGPAAPTSSSSCQTTSTAVSNVCNTNPLLRLRGLISSSHYMKGLLEVEPLHYTCHAASDGTKLEKIEPGCGCTIPVSNFISLGTSGSKKADGDFDLPEIKWEDVQNKVTQLNHLNHVVQSKLNSIIHGEQVKPLGLLSQEGESSSTSSSQQSSSNSSPWLPQYVASEKTPSPTHSAPHPIHCKSELQEKSVCEENEIPSCSTKKQSVKKNAEDLSTLLMPWQQLLVSPPQQTVVIERMHSGARRFVVLDFGAPVMLTDMIVPACNDLLLLSVDVWLCSEEQDGQRLVVASDIATKALVLSDLHPPPICRYLKITTIGRYGMTTTRCKIPIGSFFGHTMILPGESNPANSDVLTLSESNVQAQIGVLGALLEDIHCRYALACSRLRELLSPLLQSDTSNAAHMHCYLQRSRDADRLLNSNLDNQRVLAAYQECVTFQHQLNIVRSVMTRLEKAYSPVSIILPSSFDNQQQIAQASTDKLRVLGEGLLDVLLYLGCLPRLSITIERPVCEQLFYWLCVGEDTRMQLSAATLLVRLCGKQQWWGQFLADTVANLFSSNNTLLFPQDRVFILLAFLGRKSLTLPSSRHVVLDAILGMFGRLLEPLSSGDGSQPLRSNTDVALIAWSLLFVSQCLDVGPAPRDDESATEKPTKEQGQQSRWDFIQGEVAMQKRAAVGVPRHRGAGGRSKRIHTIHKGSIQDDFEAAKKAFQASTQALSVISSQAANISSKLDMAIKQQELHFKKTIKHNMNHWKEQLPSSLRRIDATKRSWAGGSRRNTCSASCSSDRNETEASSETRESGTGVPFVWLPQSHCLPVARGLIALILHMDFTCNIDMFLLACKVLARIVWCSRPALGLSDLMSDAQLMRLVRMVVWQDPWGGSWAAHAITCLLQDILEGVRSSTASSVGSSAAPGAAPPPYRSAHDRAWSAKGQRPGCSSAASSSASAASAGPSSEQSAASFDASAVEDPSSADPAGASAQPPDLLTPASAPAPAPAPAPNPEASSPTHAAPSTSSVDKPGPSGSQPQTQPDSVVDLLEFISKHPSLRHEQEEMIAEDCPDAIVTTPGPDKPSTMVVLESDDSELEDFLDDILEHGRSLLKKGTGTRASLVTSTRAGCISTAMDARLDYAVDGHAEVMIRRLTILSSYNLTFSVNSLFPGSEKESSVPPTPVPSTPSDNEPASSLGMLISCFDKIFYELQIQGSCSSLESVLQLWLSLNMETSYDPANQQFDASSSPVIVVSPSAVSSLICALSWQPEMSVRAWSLAFQVLTQISNTPYGIAVEKWGTSASQGMANVISSDHQFVIMLLRFLSGSGVSSQCSDVGPTVCGAMRDLLVRLMIRTDVGSTRKPSGWMSSMLLRLSHQLIGAGGAVSGRRGPLDAQCTFFSLLLGYNFSPATVDVDLAINLLESVGVLVHTFILTSERVRSRSVSETNQSSSMCFGGLLSHVIGGEVKPPKSTSWDSLLCSILRLSCNLVQARLNRDEGSAEAMELSHASSSRSSRADVSQQTDEHKARHGGSAPSTSSTARPPFLADTLLQRQSTMVRLLSALAGCSGSPLSVLLGTRGERDGREPRALASAMSGEPLTVGDGLFHLLLTLHKKASHPKLLLQPLYDYLSSAHAGFTGQPVGALQLSEPLLWFIMKVLDTPETLTLFNAMGGIKVVCENLVHSSRVLVSSHPSLVSVVMQHLSRVAPPMPSVTKKAGTSLETYEGLQNFAPLGTITSSSATAQAADVLIQSTPSHRRARTPAWSYHFYPDELYMDLTLRLPCAILLREVQLQPHLTSLANAPPLRVSACPSAVGLEVSRDGSSPLVPICAPMPTSGTTFVRLTLDRPEVVTSVLLRLYRPHDSANIGLSQVRLLGSTTFGETSYKAQNWDVPEEEHLTKTSLGWLRLLHHCLTASGPLQTALVGSTAQVPGLLEACGGLLLLPAPVPPLLSTALEHVLLRLGLHSREQGLRLLAGLLRSPSPPSPQHGGPAGPNLVVDLLYLLGTTRDANTHSRLETMLAWLQEMASAQKGPSWSQSAEVPPRLQSQTTSAACVHSIAAVLWDCHRGGVDADLATLITYKLFMEVYQWTLLLPASSSLKAALDALLCSMCCIQPYLFPVLLKTMGAVSDDAKDMDQDGHGSAAMTDDRKEAMGAWSRQVKLTEGQLMTIAMAAQSSAAVHHLLDSGLPGLLAHSLLAFCIEEQDHSSLSDSDKENASSSVKAMASILKLFAELCSEGQLRDWLGSSDGSVFWPPLLRLLCTRSSQHAQLDPESHVYAELETATLHFLSRCCSCHPNNQMRLATVLCDVISQQESRHHNVTFLHGVSGFARRLVLQLLLESEKLRVLVHADFPLQRGGGSAGIGLRHPSHGVGHNSQLLLLSAQTTCADIIKMVVGNNTLSPLLGDRAAADACSSVGAAGGSGAPDIRKQDLGLFCSDPLSFAAGVTAKDKRSKDVKNSAARGPYAKKTRICGNETLPAGLGLTPERWLEHPLLLPGVPLPGTLTLAQLLVALRDRGYSLCAASIELKLKQADGSAQSSLPKDGAGCELTSVDTLPTPLQVFTAQGGLALLAQHLPLVYPETLRYAAQEKPLQGVASPEAMDSDWVKVDSSHVDLYEDLDDSSLLVGGSSPHTGSRPSGPSLVPTSVPPHSLAAFGLFLRLPGYAEVLLRDRKKAQCLLRLVLGVSDDGEGGDILSSSVAGVLPTLPFQVLRQLLDATPLHTDDGVVLRRTAMDIGAVHLLLACLSVFTHQSQDIHLPGVQHELVIAATKASAGNGQEVKPPKSDDKSQLYWAKGTGFGTGSTAQSWNVEQALLRQRSEEEHVTVLLQAVSSCLNPGDSVPACLIGPEPDPGSDSDSDSGEPERNRLPVQMPSLLQRSCLLPAICSYLRNDSVLDMARHIPLYRAVLQVLRALAVCPQLVSLLLPVDRRYNRGGASSARDSLSATCLLTKMKNCVDTYASRLKVRTKSGRGKSGQAAGAAGSSARAAGGSKTSDDLDQDEGLAQLIGDIQHTANLVQTATSRLTLDDESDSTGHNQSMSSGLERPIKRSLEERYLEVMQKLQFDTFEMITENGEGGYQFSVTYHFESNLRSAGDRCHPARVKRLAQEAVTLSTSLPLSYSSSVYVRCDADRLDIMKVLITGPAETPYANGCFEFDVYFPPDYPNSPMLINMETTGHHTIRFNPNLYNDGKVCLSVLNTWHGRPEEKWNAQTSSFLQVLVSIQSLILVPEPYFNEPGYERSRGTPSGNQSSREYNANICQASVKWAMLEQVRNPCPCFREVIHTHFWFKRREIIKQIEHWIADMESQGNDRRNGRAISLNIIALKRHFDQLREELNKLKAPPGLEDLAEQLEAEDDCTPCTSPAALGSPSASATPTPSHSAGTPLPAPLEQSDFDTDMEMEKIVSKVCE